MSFSTMATTRNSSPDRIDFPSNRISQINDDDALTEVLGEETAVFANHQQDQILTTDPEKTARSSHDSTPAHSFQAETNGTALVEHSSKQASIANRPNFDIEASRLPMAGDDILEPMQIQPGDPTLANLAGRGGKIEQQPIFLRHKVQKGLLTKGSPAPEILNHRLPDITTKLHSYQPSWEGSKKHQSLDLRDYLGLRDQSPMLLRPAEYRLASRSPPESQRIVLPPIQLPNDFHWEGRQAERQQLEPESRGYPQQLQTSPQHALIPLNTGPTEDLRELRQHRDLSFRHILNLSEPKGGTSSRQWSRATNESPISSVKRPLYSASPSTASSAFLHQKMPQKLAHRPILTPISPSARRDTASIDTQQSPFLPPRKRVHMFEPGPNISSGILQMPTNRKYQSKQQYRYPPTSCQTSPASFLFHEGGAQPSTPYYPGSSFGAAIQAGAGMQFQGASGVPEGPHTSPDPRTQGSSLYSGSASSSRQTSTPDPIQVLAINTSQGSYNVPVDVHQASKIADEKRARNAGASVRFRQRRKEKERETNTIIEKLQQQARDLERRALDAEQDRDRYRYDRDRLRDLVPRAPEMRHLAMQDPPSPQRIRSGSFLGMRQPPPQLAPHHTGFQGPESRSERAPGRRIDTQGESTSLPCSFPPDNGAIVKELSCVMKGGSPQIRRKGGDTNVIRIYPS